MRRDSCGFSGVIAMVGLAATTCLVTAACAQQPPKPHHASNRLRSDSAAVGSDVAGERLAALVAANLALSPENAEPTTFHSVVSLNDPDVVANARALSGQAGHNGLHYDYFRFRAALNKLRNIHADKLDIPKDTYRIYPPNTVKNYGGLVDLSNIHHAVIEGNGATLLFSYYGKAAAPLAGVIARAAVRLGHSDHIVVRDLVIDYDEPLAVPVTVGGTAGSGPQTLTVDRAYPIDAGSPLPITVFGPFDTTRRTFNLSRDMSPGDLAAWTTEYSRAGKMPYTCSTENQSATAPTSCFRYTGGQTYVFGPTEHISPIPPSRGNFIATLRDNNYGAVIIDGFSTYVTLEGITIYTSPGEGIALVGAGKAVRVSHCRVIRKPDALLAPGEPRRLISTLADAIGIYTSAGDVVIEDSEFGNQADDGLNIRSDMRRYLATGGFSLNTTSTADPAYLRVGGLVDVFDAQGQNLIAANIPIISASALPKPGNFAIELAHAMPVLQPGKIYHLRVRDFDSARVIVRNSWFHDSSERGVVIHGDNVAVVNSKFERLAESAIQVLYDNQTGNPEGPPAYNAIIADNTISDVNVHWFDPSLRFGAPPAAIAVYAAARSAFSSSQMALPGAPPVRHLVIANNTVTNVPGAGIVVSQADDVILAQNHVTQAHRHQFNIPAIDGNGILVEQVTHFTGSGNATDKPTGRAQ
jgi:hypothetical protein